MLGVADRGGEAGENFEGAADGIRGERVGEERSADGNEGAGRMLSNDDVQSLEKVGGDDICLTLQRRSIERSKRKDVGAFEVEDEILRSIGCGSADGNREGTGFER